MLNHTDLQKTNLQGVSGKRYPNKKVLKLVIPLIAEVIFTQGVYK